MLNETILTDKLIIPGEFSGLRLDQALAKMLPQFSRNQLQTWLKQGQIKIAPGKILRAKDKVQGGEELECLIEHQAQVHWTAEVLPLNVVFANQALIVVNKPAGLVVHPAPGNYQGTLVNALLHHFPELNELPRAGIVHRLDKDTSGLLVVARSLSAYKYLVEKLQRREIGRQYFALVRGKVISGGSIDLAIGRCPHNRLKRAINEENGKPARTHYRVRQRFDAHTALTVNLETGRTHQIRVHLAHLNFPIVGDPLYGRPYQPIAGMDPDAREKLQNFKRQALHAEKLTLVCPLSGEELEFTAPLPNDLDELLRVLS